MQDEAVATSVRLRRLWLDEVARSPEYLASDLAGLDSLRLRRHADQLVISGPLDFGDGDPLAGALGAFLRPRVAASSNGAVTRVLWRWEAESPPVRRQRTTDLDILDPGDPPVSSYGVVTGHLRRSLRPGLSEAAREVLSAVKVAAVSRHRLWFAVASTTVARAIGAVPGARAGLVTAVQGYQGNKVPLYRVIVEGALAREGRGLCDPPELGGPAES